jgi:hypothetical protein
MSIGVGYSGTAPTLTTTTFAGGSQGTVGGAGGGGGGGTNALGNGTTGDDGTAGKLAPTTGLISVQID